jgi:transposase
MEKLIRVGVDTSKSVFQLHGVNCAEQVVLRKQLRRRQVLEFFARLEPTKVGLEACGGSHLGSGLRALGHEVALLPPQYVKPYLKRGKNDALDAEAICEAMSRPRMGFVAVKTAEQQAALMLAGRRDQLVRQRTQVTNSIRGYAAEFGLTAATGLDKIEPLLGRIAADGQVPELAQELFGAYAGDYARLEAQIRAIEAKLRWHRGMAQPSFDQIPGVGRVVASMLVMKTPIPDLSLPRHFAAGSA